MLSDDDDYRKAVLDEIRKEARLDNPLRGYCRRIYFTRTTCQRRGGPRKGTRRKYKTHEVELLKFLPSGRCVQVKDFSTKGLDRLAEEVFSGMSIPPHVTPAQLFLDYFRQMEA
jgi:hypothetical protein